MCGDAAACCRVKKALRFILHILFSAKLALRTGRTVR